MLLFYFGYHALVGSDHAAGLMGVELLQHLRRGKQVAYMAHFGGLLTGRPADVELLCVCRPSRRQSTKKSRFRRRPAAD